MRHVLAEELRRDLASDKRDPSREWWTHSAAYRERAKARLEELRPIFALVRGWCGQEACEEFREVTALREDVDRLRGIVKDTAQWLKHCGHPQKAALVLQELDRRTAKG